MALSDIDESLVTVGKPVDGGCCYVNFSDDPVYPTDATTALDEGWVSLGDLSDQGFTEGKSISTTSHKCWHGSNVLTTVDDEDNTFSCEFIEVNRPAAAKLRYGDENVEEDATTGEVTHIQGVAGKLKSHPLIFEELESNGYKRRTVYRKATVTSFDDVPHQRGSLMLYGMTFSADEVDGKAFDIYRAKPATA